MKKIIISGATLYYNKKTGHIFYDFKGNRQFPTSSFDKHEYLSFLNQIKKQTI